MSLYRAREWWKTRCGTAEEFELGSVAIGNVDNDPTQQSKIVTGSLNGYLRVYQPHGRDFTAEDLLLETQLQAPILQLELRNFASLGGIQLAVLQPHRLQVCQLTSLVTGQGMACMQLNVVSQHSLDRSAANMVFGNFGGSQGVQQICVQSMDGQLTFYEREALTFSRFLPQFLLPGPLCYNPAVDCFITCSSAFEVQCYKYQSLVAAQAAAEKETGTASASPRTQGRQLHTEWQWTFGEMAWDIQPGQFTVLAKSASPDLILLGERTLVILSSEGQLRWQKRFDYQPVAMTLYPVMEGRHNLLVAAATGQMMVYSQNKLVWAAKGDAVPVAIKVAAIADVQGLVLTLEDTGVLALTYMGTDPPTQAVNRRHSAEVDYAALDSEYRQLTSQIQNIKSPVKAAAPEQLLVVTAQVPSLLDSSDALPHDTMPGMSQASLTFQLYVRYLGVTALTDVTVSLSAPAGLLLSQEDIVLPHVAAAGADTAAASVSVQAWKGGVPTDNCISGVATYTLPSGQPRTTSFQVMLPLTLFCQLVAPQQTAQQKLTLEINRPPPLLLDLFQDLVAQSQMDLQQQNRLSNVMSFKYFDGPVVTILVSKTAGRYRVQSDSLPAMWLIVEELGHRLAMFVNSAESSAATGDQAFAVSFKEALPLEELWICVDQHLASRHAAAAIEARLAQLALQLRAVQKRMLLRFKDKQPASLAHLDLLIQDTFTQLQDLGYQHEQRKAESVAEGQQLSAMLKLVLQLIRHQFGLSDADASLLATYLSPEVPDTDPGWEELTEASMLHLCCCVSPSMDSLQAELLALPVTSQKLQMRVQQVLKHLSSGVGAPFAALQFA